MLIALLEVSKRLGTIPDCLGSGTKPLCDTAAGMEGIQGAAGGGAAPSPCWRRVLKAKPNTVSRSVAVGGPETALLAYFREQTQR